MRACVTLGATCCLGVSADSFVRPPVPSIVKPKAARYSTRSICDAHNKINKEHTKHFSVYTNINSHNTKLINVHTRRAHTDTVYTRIDNHVHTIADVYTNIT